MTSSNNITQALHFSDILHTRMIGGFLMGVFPLLPHLNWFQITWRPQQIIHLKLAAKAKFFTDMKGGCCKNLSGIPLFLHSYLKLRYLTNIQCSSFSAWMWRLQYFSFLNPVPLLLAKICLRCSLTQMHNH